MRLSLNDTAPPEIYPLSLHDALPILRSVPWSYRGDFPRGHCLSRAVRLFRRRLSQRRECAPVRCTLRYWKQRGCGRRQDRKSTRLNSSHVEISYAVFCLKKKKMTIVE